jgi:hypothetical protein
VDPFTLFALANGAVAAVKKGCQLYKDIKGAAGEVKAVLKDLDDQFNKAHPPDKPASPAAIKQLAEEKAREKEEKVRIKALEDIEDLVRNGYSIDNERVKNILDEFKRNIEEKLREF